MSHEYSIYFTTKEGKFMGQWAIQDHFTKDNIEAIKEKWDIFGEFYEVKKNYDCIEITIPKLFNMEMLDDIPTDIMKGMKYALNSNLRIFLG